MSGIHNIYIVTTPLQYYSAEQVARHFEEGSRNFLYFVRRDIESVVDKEMWTDVVYLPWPRKDPKKGMFGVIRRTYENLQLVAEQCRNASEIRVHSWVLVSEVVNYHINYLKHRFPSANIVFRMLPDGVMNTTTKSQRRISIGGQYLRKLRRLIYPSMNYYLFKGDRLGSDAPITDRIYLPYGFPHEYDNDKVVRLPKPSPAQVTVDSTNKRALVVSQPLYDHCKSVTKAELSELTEGIYNYIISLGIQSIDYKAHPYDRYKELYHPSYRELIIDEPLEKYLLKTHYDLIVGVTTTVLFSSKIVFGNSVKVVSYGLDVLENSSRKWQLHFGKKKIAGKGVTRKLIKETGVERVDHYSR